jgi:hypothetical protein
MPIDGTIRADGAIGPSLTNGFELLTDLLAKSRRDVANFPVTRKAEDGSKLPEIVFVGVFDFVGLGLYDRVGLGLCDLLDVGVGVLLLVGVGLLLLVGLGDLLFVGVGLLLREGDGWQLYGLRL